MRMTQYLSAGALALVLLAAGGCEKNAAPMPRPAPHAAFDPLKTFAPLALPQPVNEYRSADGTPGPAYWQNRADYAIRATLNTQANRIAAEETITYTNNSPTALDCLWLQLDQNAYRKDSRAHYAGSPAATHFTEGFVLDDIETGPPGHAIKADTTVSDTRLQIRLGEALKARGGRLEIRIRYHFTVPGAFGGRTGHARTRNGEIYDIAQWYPRMAVYDDLRGWDTLPYLGSEFYLEYGDFDYSVTVPWDMLVAGSGELVNPQEVLTPTERRRLDLARSSDATVMIRGAGEIGDPKSRPRRDGTLTWHFRMKRTRDVSFSASPAFIWDAARTNLPDGKSALAMSFYPLESAGDEAWGRSTEYLKDAVENFSRRWSPYPWPAAINVGGPVGGMEYPGIVFDAVTDKGKSLFAITAHEIGHSWFPMMVGTDERRDPWMDEGLNTFIDVYESDDFRHGAYGPKRDSEYAPGGGNPAEEILPLLRDAGVPVILTAGDQIAEKYRHPVSYFKPALGLVLLRERIVGRERFDWAFRKFIRDWSFRHPSPSDFFRAMDSSAGEDLSWFWRGWFMNNWTLDLAVAAVRPLGGDWRRGAVATIANLDPLVMPAVVEIDFKDGAKLRLTLPADIWQRKTSIDLNLDGSVPVVSVTIDPDHVIPDNDRRNNVWRG